MKGLENRLIIINQSKFKFQSLYDFVSFIRDLTSNINMVDNDLFIKQAFELVMLKEKRIKQFKGTGVKEFHQDIFDVIESSGTQFLISKN